MLILLHSHLKIKYSGIKAEKKGVVDMDLINRQFPVWQSKMEQLYQENEDFREMCQDYEEVHNLLATWTSSTEVNPAIIAEYRTLLKELEAEIMEALQTRFQPAKLREQDTATQPNSTIAQGGDEADLSKTPS